MRINKIIHELKIVNLHQITNLYSLETVFKTLSIYITPIFYYLKCSANTTTLLALLVGLSAGIIHLLYGYQYYYICFILYFFSVLIDYCDGNIARLTKTTSFYGRFIDGLFDIFVLGLLQISILYVLLNNPKVLDENYSILIGNDLIFILIMISVFLTPIQHLIYDRYSAYIRWINIEHNSDLHPTLRHEVSFKIINFFDDLCFLCLIFAIISIQFFIIYFLINLCLSIYLILLHIFYSKKNMTVFADDHRKIKK